MSHSFTRYKRSMLVCFELLKKIQINPDSEHESAYKLQEIVLKRIVQCEGRIRKYKRQRDLLKKSMADKDARLTKEKAKEVKQALLMIEQQIKANHNLIWIYREVGDGIAYTYIDAFDIKPLSFKQSPGFISRKKGARLERQILRASSKLGRPAIYIMNDLTNCLRYGDFTVALRNRVLTVIEAKSGKSKLLDERHERQFVEANNMLSYLKSDKTDRLYGESGQFSRVDAHESPVRNIAAINQLIDQCNKHGQASKLVERGLAYFVSRVNPDEYTFKIPRNSTDEWSLQFVNDYKYRNIGNYPFSLSIADPKNLFAFYNGEYVITILFNQSQFGRDLFRKGVTLINPDEVNFPNSPFNLDRMVCFAKDNSTDVIAGCSDHMFGRMFVEFLSFKWFRDEFLTGIKNLSILLEEQVQLMSNKTDGSALQQTNHDKF